MKRIMAVFIMAAVLLCGCKKTADQPVSIDQSVVQGEPDYGGEITLYSFQQDTFNPLLTQIKANYDVLSLIYEPIVRVDDSGKVQGVLAKSWSKSDDGAVYTLDIRNDVKFHDGSDLTAQDVSSSLSVATSDQSPFSHSLMAISSVKAQGDSVVVRLSYPVHNFISLLEIPVVKSSDAKEAEGKPMGTGPYRYEGSSTSKEYTLVASEDWWQGKAYISKVNVVILSDKEAVHYAYDAGNIQAFSTDVITAGKYAGDGKSRVKYYSDDVLIFLGFNNLSPTFAPYEARKAVADCIDKDKINNDVALGDFLVTHTPVNPQRDIYCKDVTTYSGGKTETEVTPFELLVCTSNVINSRIGEAIAKQLADKGFAVTLTSLDETEYLARIESRQYDAFVGGFSVSANGDISRLLSEGNYFNYSSDLMGEYLGRLGTNLSDGDIKTTFDEIQKLYSTDLPFVSLFYQQQALVVRNTVGGDLTPNSGTVYSKINDWYTKTK